MKTIKDYSIGQKVTVKGVGKAWGSNAYINNIPQSAKDMVGKECEIFDIDEDMDQIEIYTPDREDTWVFHVSELEEETILPPPPQREAETILPPPPQKEDGNPEDKEGDQIQSQGGGGGDKNRPNWILIVSIIVGLLNLFI